MNITRGLPPAPLASFPVLTIGNFDGQHVGHRALLEAVVESAQPPFCGGRAQSSRGQRHHGHLDAPRRLAVCRDCGRSVFP